MSKAAIAAKLVVGWCKSQWPDDGSATSGSRMASTMLGSFVDAFAGYKGGGSHKYIEELDEMNALLGLEKGSGIFAYEMFDDGTRIFMTCDGPLAVLDVDGLRWV